MGEQQRMLEAEGVLFDEEGRVLMEQFQWDGRDEGADASLSGLPADLDREAELAD